MRLQIGKRYLHTYPSYTIPANWPMPAKHIEAETVYYTVEDFRDGTYYIVFDNGARNKFEETSPFHMNSKEA